MRRGEETIVGEALIAGRYILYDEIGAGGMATVHLGRQLGTGGFARTVAIKRLHPNLGKDRDFVAMFLDEARLCSRIRHPNVVFTLDVVEHAGELLLVMEYVPGETLLRLLRAASAAGNRVPPSVAAQVFTGILAGLHAAHEAVGEDGAPLRIVHRDVSPANILVGSDGIARIVDFGIAKAAGRIHTTRDGAIKGKVAYMSPEQLRGGHVDRRTDTYAAAVALWETLVGERLFFCADSQVATMTRVLEREVPAPGTLTPDIPPELDGVVMRGLARDKGARFETASAMAEAIAAAVRPASATEVAMWVAGLAGEESTGRAHRVLAIERGEARPLTLAPLAPLPAPRERTGGRVTVVAAGALALIAGTFGVTRFALVRAEQHPEPPAMLGMTGAVDATIGSAAAPAIDPAASVAPVANKDKEMQASADAAAPHSARRASPSRTTTTSCNPPYRLDERGIRRPKPECL
jgi:serine/threonine-protein kinase